MSPRQPRDKRRSSAQVRLGDRDAALLRALNRFRIARTSDLAEFAFAGVRPDTAARRLRRLFDGGWVDVRAGDRAEQNLYQIGPNGKRWLISQGEVSGRSPRGGIAHHLAIVRAWLDLAVVTHELPGVALNLFRPDWEIRERVAAGHETVVPDGLAMLQVGSAADALILRTAVEVDLGTEPLSVLRRKLCGYTAAEGAGGVFGWKNLGIATYLPGVSVRRRDSIERLLGQAWPGWYLVWSERAELRESVYQLVDGLFASPHELPLPQGDRDRRNSLESRRLASQ
ncbi:MAG: replication-relaxation family protein [Candidatus Eisenbacteria bacterium]|nr:replication-relaxation family protein [Candidatus Eisenbacteria bacterium]